ncbi:hypothetical protein ABW21_db0207603 [Orbilia brochopaga]|nr:hypothetical protein ABW21_db0207603 [Drechslerella brochopaga]
MQCYQSNPGAGAGTTSREHRKSYGGQISRRQSLYLRVSKTRSVVGRRRVKPCQVRRHSSAPELRTFSYSSTPEIPEDGADEDSHYDEFPRLPEYELEELDFPDDPFENLPTDDIFGAEAGTGTDLRNLRLSGNLSEYRTIRADSPAASLFNSAVDEIFAWLSQSGASAFCFTLVRSYGLPVVVVFSKCFESLPPNCPIELPVELIRRSLVDFDPGRYDSCDQKPWNPWYTEKVQPGASIGCNTSGSLGGYLRSQDGRIFGLTAGHVAREFLTDVRVIKDGAKLTSPSAFDARLGKYDAKRWLVEYEKNYELTFQDAKLSLRDVRREPDNAEFQCILKEWRERLNAVKTAYKTVAAYRKDSEKGARKFAETIMSVVDLTRYLDDNETKCNWQRNEDWALLRPETDCIGHNALTFSDRSVRLETFGSIAPGMLVVKKGRSTSATFGCVNGVQLHTKLETSRGPTAEWIVLPLKPDEVDGPKSTRLFGGFVMRDELDRPFLSDLFAHIGDSGSFVVAVETGQVVGMVVGGVPNTQPPVCVVTPFTTIIHSMNERLRRYNIQFGTDCLVLKAPETHQKQGQ